MWTSLPCTGDPRQPPTQPSLVALAHSSEQFISSVSTAGLLDIGRRQARWYSDDGRSTPPIGTEHTRRVRPEQFGVDHSDTGCRRLTDRRTVLAGTRRTCSHRTGGTSRRAREPPRPPAMTSMTRPQASPWPRT